MILFERMKKSYTIEKSKKILFRSLTPILHARERFRNIEKIKQILLHF